MGSDDIAMRSLLDAGGYLSGIDQMINKTEQLGIKTSTANTSLGGFGTLLGTLANPMTAFALAATSAGAALAGSVQAASTWQSAMANVSKTTGLAGTDLQGLSKDLLNMSTSMPTSAGELASIAGVAGSLGVAKENIAGFTQAAAMMSVGFEMNAEQAATSAAKILTAYGKPIDTKNMMALGNVVNTMGDNFAATEPQVLDFINRASFLNTTMGQTIPNIAALGTVLISAGMESETASTGLKSFLNTATSLTSKTGGLDNWAKLLGTSVDDLQNKLKTDFNMTLVETADKIAAIEDPTERFQAAVALAGTEGAPALLKLAGQADNLKRAMGSANSEWSNGSSLMKTYEAQSATLDSQMQIFQNTLNKAAVELGTVLLPAVTEGVKDLTDFTKAAISAGEAVYGMTTGASNAVGGWFEGADKWIINNLGGGFEAPKALDMGKMVGDTYADGIAQSDLATAPGDTLQSDAALAATEDAAEANAKAFADKAKAWWDTNGAAAMAGFGQIGRQYDANGNVISEGSWGNWTEGRSVSDMATPGNEVIGSVEIGGKTFVYQRIEENEGMFRYSLKTPDGVVHDFGVNSNPAEEVVKYTEQWADTQLSKLEKAKEQGNIQEVVRLTRNVAVDNAWEQWNSEPHMTQWAEDNKKVYESVGQDLGNALYYGMGIATVNGDKQLQQDMQNVLKAISDPGSVSKDILNMSLGDLIDHNIISSKWKPEIEQAANEALSGDVIVNAGQALKTKMEDLGHEAGTALKDGILTVQEQETLTKLAEEYVKAGGNASDEMIKAILAKDWNGLGATIGGDTGRGFTSAIVGEIKGAAIPSITEMLKDPSKLAAIGDIPLFIENTFQPALKREMAEMNKTYQSGYDVDMKAATEYVDKMEKVWEGHASWFEGYQSRLFTLYKNGEIDAAALLDVWDRFENASSKASDATKKQSEGYDQLSKAISDCADCAISGFGTWQEKQDGLFQGSYIGSNNEQYLQWWQDQQRALQEAAWVADQTGSVKLGMLNQVEPLAPQEKQVKITADTTEYDGSFAKVMASMDQVVKLADPIKFDADTKAALTKYDELVNEVSKTLTIPVVVDVAVAADDIRALVIATVRAAANGED